MVNREMFKRMELFYSSDERGYEIISEYANGYRD